MQALKHIQVLGYAKGKTTLQLSDLRKFAARNELTLFPHSDFNASTKLEDILKAMLTVYSDPDAYVNWNMAQVNRNGAPVKKGLGSFLDYEADVVQQGSRGSAAYVQVPRLPRDLERNIEAALGEPARTTAGGRPKRFSDDSDTSETGSESWAEASGDDT